MRKTNYLLIFMMLLVMSVVAACSNDEKVSKEDRLADLNEEGFPIVNEKITLSMMGARHPIQISWDEMKFFNEMEEKTNIAFDITEAAMDGYEETKNLAFASDDVPDVFFGGMLTPEDEVKYGSQGILRPLNDLIEEYAPNIQKLFEEKPDVARSLTTSDGNIYTLPMVNQASIAVTAPMWINGDWLEALGVEELPTNTDELYDLLVRFRDEDPDQNGKDDSIPLSSVKLEDGVQNTISSAFGHLTNGVEVKNDEVHFAPIQDTYKEYLKYMHKLYAEGLLDNESFSQEAPDLTAKGHENKVGMFVHAGAFLVLNIENEEDNYKHPALPVLTSPFNDEKMYPANDGIIRGAFAMSSDNPYPEATMRWVDYLYSLEGSIYVHYGKEGDLWEFADEDAGIRRQPPENIPEGMNGEEYRGTITPDVGTPLPKYVRAEVEEGWDQDSHYHRFAETDEKLAPHFKIPYPSVYFKEEEQSRLSVLSNDIETYRDEMMAQFITSGGIEEGWDEYVSTLEQMNIEEYVSIHQDAYDRWLDSDF